MLLSAFLVIGFVALMIAYPEFIIGLALFMLAIGLCVVIAVPLMILFLFGWMYIVRFINWLL